jgi:HEPN domain-containing protein
MPNRAKDWMNQAERDLKMAATSAEAERHEWACFGAQQAAEAAVKVLHQSRGQQACGCAVHRLPELLPEDALPAPTLIDGARALDLHYLSARDPS